MPTVPEYTPCSAIWMTRLSIDASTRPSTTNVSQSVISTPFNLMSGPTMSLLPDGAGEGEDDSAGIVAGVSATGVGAGGVVSLRPAIDELRCNRLEFLLSF